MKKFIIALCTCLFFLPFFGCNASAESKAQNTVTSFLTNLENGKLEEAYSYVNEGADTAFSSFQEQKESIIEYFNANNADKETIEIIDQTFSELLKTFMQGHKINEVTKVSDEECTVKATLTIVDPDAISEKISEIDMSSFMNDISGDALDIYANKGEEAANTYIMSKLATWLQTTYTDTLKGINTIEENTTFTVKKINEEWLISDMVVE